MEIENGKNGELSQARQIAGNEMALKRLGGFAEPGFHDRFGFDLALADFELAENGLEADEKLMPLSLDGAKAVVVHLAEKTDGWRGGDQRVNVVAADGSAINGGKDEFELLGNDALDLEKLVLVFLAEALGARHTHEGVVLLPAFEVALQPENQLVDIGFAHNGKLVASDQLSVV
jgi:hypothetical protein